MRILFVGRTTIPASASSLAQQELEAGALPAPLPADDAPLRLDSPGNILGGRRRAYRDAGIATLVSARRPPCGGLLFGGANGIEPTTSSWWEKRSPHFSYGPNREDPVSHPFPGLLQASRSRARELRSFCWPTPMRSPFSRFQPGGLRPSAPWPPPGTQGLAFPDGVALSVRACEDVRPRESDGIAWVPIDGLRVQLHQLAKANPVSPSHPGKR